MACAQKRTLATARGVASRFGAFRPIDTRWALRGDPPGDLESMDQRVANPAILFLHDGELCELREPLRTLGCRIAERHGGPLDEDCGQPWDLVLASAKRMLALERPLSEISTVRIAVLDGDSKTLRSMLRQAGTDLLVRRPVHPVALRLLILHSLYQGPEKRRTGRVSIGAAIRFRSGLRRRNAILTELSPKGCRMLAPIGSHNAKSGANLTLQLPAGLCDGRALTLSGRILRVEDGDCGTNAIAVSFTRLGSSNDRKLRAIIAAHAEGPATLDGDAAGALASLPDMSQGQPRPDAVSPPFVSAGEMNADRRQQPRHDIEQRIIALSHQASRVLMGRDLSAGGLRIDSAPGLVVGDRLKIALHGNASPQPLVLNAEVSRDDGRAGLGLRFLDLSADQHELIVKLLDELPRVSEPDESAKAGAVFVSQLLARQSG
jgi:hypothetical protein